MGTDSPQMTSRSAKGLKAQANVKPGYSLGITGRLVLGYTAATLLALIVASVSIYYDLRHSMEMEDAENLTDHVNMLRREMAQRPHDLSAATEIIRSAAEERRVEQLYGRLRHENGRVVVETPGFASFAPADGVFPSPVRLVDDVTTVKRSQTPGGVLTFLAAARVGKGPQGSRLTYEVVMDATRASSWLRGYRNDFLLMVVGGTVGSGILAWFITRRGLRPLREIASTMQRVTVSGMNERVGTSGQPKELAALAVEFDKMLDRLGEPFQRLALFSADAAHEFRTPLNNLMMATSLTLARERTAEEYRHALTGNLEEFERLKRMVDRLLFLARAENAETILNKSSLDAGEVVGGVLDFFSALAEERGMTLACEGQGNVHADEALLRQALANLLSNALRHTPSGGHVGVRIQTSDAGCVISVSDTGPGIPELHWPKLFDRFYRVDAARSSEGDSGAGLGLAIVKTIMKMHHGDVTVSSGNPTGSCFQLVFPARQEGTPPVHD